MNNSMISELRQEIQRIILAARDEGKALREVVGRMNQVVENLHLMMIDEKMDAFAMKRCLEILNGHVDMLLNAAYHFNPMFPHYDVVMEEIRIPDINVEPLPDEIGVPYTEKPS